MTRTSLSHSSINRDKKWRRSGCVSQRSKKRLSAKVSSFSRCVDNADLFFSVEAELEARQSELARIEQAVAAQNLTPDEVQRMNHERDSLTRSLEDLRNKISEASQFAYDQEMVVTKSMDRFEGLLTDYNSLAHQIGLLDSSLDAPSLAADVNYNLDVDLGAEELEEVKAVGVRMRSIIWQALQTCRETFRQEALGLGNGTIALEDEFDKLGQSVERQKEEVGNLEVRLKIVHNQAEDAQSVSGKLFFEI